ncbi:MAG TPA: 4'-phosphopantetheinyl transferase superfamily protein [Gemmatimonadaceae bacterium]|nr:4'-phosphopantetheinyl transferase superfamily protein [Gemmatimonadaceae bacterium]
MTTAERGADAVGADAARALGVELRARQVALDGHEVRVWTAALDRLAEAAAVLSRFLSDDERAQVASMRVPRTAERFCGGRAALRVLLGAELSCEPASLRFVVGPHGKPALEPAAGHGLAFNVAHSAGVVAIAVSRAGDVGIDVERRREVRALDRLVVRALTPDERALFERWIAEGASSLDAFLRAWTVKEARLKALGLPIGAGLSRDHALSRQLPWCPFALPEGEDYFGAVALSTSRS